ncbi:thiamine biosynthetic bifunctional enzyme [Diplocarpon rosae]|nr:thiamine biosynthetic bifunctional enzyme [Diplocarpon rosae]
MEESCCTCAALLKNVRLVYDEKSEKPKAIERRLECCGRMICGICIAIVKNNQRFAAYCPFCQVSTKPSPLPQGLRDPPSYTLASTSKLLLPQHSVGPPPYSDVLPTYSSLTEQRPAILEKASPGAAPAEDVLHFLDHENDSFTSLSFRYGIPIPALRKANNITSDHLLLARRTILIPGEFYKGGVSLSPRPIEGEEEERRKGLVRRWMVACKVSEYDVALTYLKQVDYDLDAAVEAYKEDERWEKEHPLEASVTGKGRRHDVGRRRFTGQR